MMARKTFIKVRRGILDAQHTEKLGAAWYLFFYMLDQADWETGIISGWKDQFAADDLQKPLSQIRFHRQHLEKEKYIICTKRQHDQIITINRWKDPRKDTFEEPESKQNLILSDSRVEPELSESRVRVEPELSESFKSPSINLHSSSSQISDIKIPDVNKEASFADKSANEETIYEDCLEDGNPLKTQKRKKPKTDPRSSLPAIIAFHHVTGIYPPKPNYDQVICLLGDHPDEQRMLTCYQSWCARGYKPTNMNWLLEWYADGGPPGKLSPKNKPLIGLDAVKAEQERLRKQNGK